MLHSSGLIPDISGHTPEHWSVPRQSAAPDNAVQWNPLQEAFHWYPWFSFSAGDPFLMPDLLLVYGYSPKQGKQAVDSMPDIPLQPPLPSL